jgi:VanZ family protein
VGLSLIPTSSFKHNRWGQFEHLDKIVHFGFYLIMAITLLVGFHGNTKLKFGHYLFSFVFCAVLGVLMEIFQQSDLVHRHFEILDIIANIIGALLGSVLFLKILKYLPHGSRN